MKKVKNLKEFDLTEEEMKKLKELLAEDEETKEEEVTDEEATAETTTEISEEAGGEEAAGEATEEDREGEEAAEDKLELKECEEEEEKECEDEQEIRSLGDLVNKRALAEKFIRAHKSLKEFKAALKQNVNNRNLKDNNKMQKFSIRKAILAKAGRIKADEAKFELDVIAENQRKFNSDADIVLSKRELRAFDGTEALNQPVYQPGLYTPNLRPPVTVDAIGTKKVAVTGPSITFSVCTSGITAGFVGLDGDVPSATMDFQLKRMDPKKQGAFVDIAYSSLLQDDPSAEGIVMDDIFKALDQSKDNAFWNGLSGNNEPIGLLNTAGVNEVTLPDTPTLSTALEFEKKIRESYDYSGNLKWVFGSEAYYKWASTPYSATEQNKMLLDPDDRKCIGYDCYMDPNLPASGVVLGNFEEALEADFDGIELHLITEDKDLARKQAVEVIAWRALDFLCRRPKSFSKRSLKIS